MMIDNDYTYVFMFFNVYQIFITYYFLCAILCSESKTI